MDARILITGSLSYTDNIQNRLAATQALENAHEQLSSQGFDSFTVVHGDAEGADRLLADIAKSKGFNVEAHPVDWDAFGREPVEVAGQDPIEKAVQMQNQNLIDRGANLVLGFPNGKALGTRHCMKIAEEQGIPVWNVSEDTTTEQTLNQHTLQAEPNSVFARVQQPTQETQTQIDTNQHSL